MSGIHYTPEKTRNYEAFVKMLAVEAMKGNKPIEGACTALISVYYPIPKSTSKKKALQMIDGKIYPTKKPDIDNIVKAIFDAMNGIVFIDDSQVVSLSVHKIYESQAETIVWISEKESKC
jgi:Holliday junction resolvase RusA-like endonuclease